MEGVSTSTAKASTARTVLMPKIANGSYRFAAALTKLAWYMTHAASSQPTESATWLRAAQSVLSRAAAMKSEPLPEPGRRAPAPDDITVLDIPADTWWWRDPGAGAGPDDGIGVGDEDEEQEGEDEEI